MAEFYSVSLEEMDALLRPMRFQPVDLTYRRRPVKEWVYQRPLPNRDNHFVRVYTGINRYGQQQNQSRGVGKDAIRVQVVYRDPAGFETLVTQPKRVHRVRGWADNLANRLDEINRTRPQVAFDSRGKPMTLRKGKTGWFWGSSDYPRYKETRPFQAEGEVESEFYGGIPIIDLNSKKEIEEYGFFRPYEPNPSRKEERLRESLTDAPENNNLFRITCDDVYAVRTIYGPSKIIFGRNMLASNKMSFNRSAQANLSGVWRLMGLPRNNSGVVSAFGPLENIEKMPQFSEKPVVNLINSWSDPSSYGELIPNRIVINMKGLVFAYDIVHREIEFYGGVPQSSIVSQDIPPEVVKPEMAVPESIWKNRRDYESLLRRYNSNNRRFRQGLKGEIDVPDEEYINYWNQFAAEDNYDSTYGKAQAKIRRRLKKKIMAQAIMGTKAGQWSARKSQELKRQYEAACERRDLAPYKGQKTQSQKNLSNWSQQKWRTASGKNSSDTGEPYFPAKAVAALKKKGLYAKAKRQKAAATKAGKQNARYSDDIRAVVRKYRAEETPETDFNIGEILISDLIPNVGDKMLYIPYPTAEPSETWLNREQRWKYIIAERFGEAEEDYSLKMWWSGKEEFVYLLEPEEAKKYLADYISPADIFGKLFLSSEPVWEQLAFNKAPDDDEFWFNWRVNMGSSGESSRLRNSQRASRTFGRNQIRLGDLDKINTNLEGDYRKQQTIHADQLPDAKSFLSESDDIPDNWELVELEGHSALYRQIDTADYNTTWQLVEFADDLNLRLKHHATVQFTASSVEIWLWTHDSGEVTYRDEYWAETYNELLQIATVVDNLEFNSETVPEDWEDIKWKEEKTEPIGDEADWDAEDENDWGSLQPMQLNERGDYYPTQEAYVEAMLRRFSKMNIDGEQGCPVCGSEILFMREETEKGTKWRCYGCNYSDERLSEKSKKIDTLEKFGLTLLCPDCGESYKAYNRAAIRYHKKKCGV